MDKLFMLEVGVISRTLSSLSATDIIEMLKSNPIRTLQQYHFSDSDLFKYRKNIPLDVMIDQNMTEELFCNLLDDCYLSPDDIKNLNMTTYSNLKESTIDQYIDYINFEKLGFYLIADDNFNVIKYEKQLNSDRSLEFWEIFSTINLPIELLEKYKEFIIWDLFFTTNPITNDIQNKFADIVEEHYLETPKDKKMKIYQIEVDQRISIDIDTIDELINNIK